MIYNILLETSIGIISLKNTSTNKHVESANLIYIALGGTIYIFHNCISFFRVIDHHHREHHILQHWQIFQCESCDYYSEKVSETQKHVKLSMVLRITNLANVISVITHQEIFNVLIDMFRDIL